MLNDVRSLSTLDILPAICLTISFLLTTGAVFSSHSSLPGPHRYSNLTNKQISTLLQDGFQVMEFSGLPPMVLDADVAYEPSQVLPKQQRARGRAETHAASAPYLWIDKTGKAELFYFYDTKSPPDRTVFEKAVQHWSKHTCIQFTKMRDRSCHSRMTHGAVCVGNFGGVACFSKIGNCFLLNGGYAQQSSVGECSVYGVAHEFGHSIGFHHCTMRADRDQFLTVNFHNFMVDMFGGGVSANSRWKTAWRTGRICKKGVLYQTRIPIPYDYLSIMGFGEADFGDDDFKVIYVTKNPRHQYMLDYKGYSGLFTTHFDRYLMNLMYKCIDKWAMSCALQGKSPPKCKNFGYVTRDCKCACPKGTKGSECEQMVHGTLFPMLDRAKTVVAYPGPGVFTLKEYSEMEESLPSGFPDPDFQYTQYATILLKATDDKTTPSVRVFEPGEVSQHPQLKRRINRLVQELSTRDCKMGLRLYWGDFPSGRVRTECFSTFVNNEPEENSLVLRAKTQEVSLVFIGRQGHLLGSAKFTKWMLEMLIFHVSFPRNARKAMKVKPVNENPARPPPPVTNGSESLGKDSTAAAMKAPTGGADAVVVAFVLLVLLCCLLPCLMKRKRKKEPVEDESVASSTSAHSHTSHVSSEGSGSGSTD